MPREQLEELGVNYRRIPIMAIGRDVCDTRIMLAKLEELFPDNRLGARTPFDKGVEYLLENWVIDGGPFWRTAGLIPIAAEVMNDPEWLKDRASMSGNNLNKESKSAATPESLAHVRMYFDFLESSLLADGRRFILDSSQPTLADIHAGWLFDWNLQMKMGMIDHLEKETISEQAYPKVFAWVQNIRDAVAEVEKKNGEAKVLSDQEMIETILSSDYSESEGSIDNHDPLKLEKGQAVDIAPVDSGFTHHDKGELVAIGTKEVVIKSAVPNGKGHLRLHFPRTNFRIKPEQGSKL